MAPSKSSLTRRNLFQAAALAGAGTIVSADSQAEKEGVELRTNDIILFQGDSITDAGRDKDNAKPNDLGALGRGYAAMVASALLGAYPDKTLQCYNRGISGNKVPDLDARWQPDAIDLKPALLSLLIGVNDMWHVRSGKYDGTVETYDTGLNALLARTREALPDTTLVVCEPFILPCGAIDDSWHPEFDERRAAAQAAASKAGAIWVPFQLMFDTAISEHTPAKHWAGDGVHPTMAGHALMANTWLEVTGLGCAKG